MARWKNSDPSNSCARRPLLGGWPGVLGFLVLAVQSALFGHAPASERARVGQEATAAVASSAPAPVGVEAPLAEGEPIARLRAAACADPELLRLAAASGSSLCAGEDAAPDARDPRSFASALATGSRFSARLAPASSPGDGQLIDRQRLLTVGPVALDLVAYLSSGLVVGGLLCFVDDGQPRSTVIHLHGGLGGIFVNPDGGDTIGSCYRWAASHGRTAFVPSFRGQDGGQGLPELCLGEADDVAAAAILLRSLPVTDPNRLALIGGSMGGCVALRAGARIPGLRAVVAIAPPLDFQALTTFHRTSYVPANETRCDGSTLAWAQGGPQYADTLDGIICGHPGCSSAEYAMRTPLLDVQQSTNPTLVLTGSADNLVPPDQQVLWPIFRNQFGGSVAVAVRDRCSAAQTLPHVQDVFLFIPGAYHLMEDGPIVSGLIWLTELLDAPDAGAGTGL